MSFVDVEVRNAGEGRFSWLHRGQAAESGAVEGGRLGRPDGSNKKTGFLSQRMSEKPGEFQIQFQSRITWDFQPWLLRAMTERQWAIKEQTEPGLPENDFRNPTVLNHSLPTVSSILRK